MKLQWQVSRSIGYDLDVEKGCLSGQGIGVWRPLSQAQELGAQVKKGERSSLVV
jgi:antirestriction protein ArdC